MALPVRVDEVVESMLVVALRDFRLGILGDPQLCDSLSHADAEVGSARVQVALQKTFYLVGSPSRRALQRAEPPWKLHLPARCTAPGFLKP